MSEVVSDVNERVEDVVLTILKAISSHPKLVKVDIITSSDQERTIEVTSSPEDYPRFIGRNGVVIDAIRKIIFTVAANEKCKWIISIPQEK